MKLRFILFVFILVASVLFSFCRKSKKRAPLVTTSAVSPRINEAQCSGVLYSEGDAAVTEKGFCWGTKESISVADNKVISGSDEQTFTAEISGLEPNKTYYVRAYAENEFGISYGKAEAFATHPVSFPSITLLNSFNNPAAHSITLSLQVYQTIPFSFTTGICWSKTSIPTLQNFSVQISSRSSSDAVPFSMTYMQKIENLEEATSYYARAFAASKYGVVYGNQIYWTTPAFVNPVVFSIAAVGHTVAACNVSVTGMDVSLVKSVGVCWSKNQSPTILDSKQEQTLSGINSFYLSMTSNTTYYLRGYITTSTETIYGPVQKKIRTLKGTVVDVSGNIYNTVEIGGQEWMTSNYRASSFDDGTPIPLVANYNQWVNSVNNYIPAYCYYNDNTSNNNPYGKLYPKYVAQASNFPPFGWRLPNAHDWEVLAANTSIPDLCVMNGTWQSPTITNSSGFSVYPAGYWGSGYLAMGSKTNFWLTTLTSSLTEDNTFQFSSYNTGAVSWFSSGSGQSVRFIRQ